MAFVQPATTLRFTSSFTRSGLDTKPVPSSSTAPSRANLRMTETKEEESRAVGIVGQSLWKENLFAGGFPGGEAFFKDWISKGMEGDVPDMPSSMQPSAEFKPVKKAPRTGVLADLDRTEFFKDFEGQAAEEDEDDESEDSDAAAAATARTEFIEVEDEAPSDILSTEIPSDEVYGKYYPDYVRFLAPKIDIQYTGSPDDHVSVSMEPVSASYTDLYFPAEMKNKAPVIDIFYAGSLATASLGVSMEEIDPIPTPPIAPSKPNDTYLSLDKGPGGGLKLNFETESGEKII